MKRKLIALSLLNAVAMNAFANPQTAQWHVGNGVLDTWNANLNVINTNSKGNAVVSVDNFNIFTPFTVSNGTGNAAAKLVIIDTQGSASRIMSTLYTDITTIVANPNGIYMGYGGRVFASKGIAFVAGSVNTADLDVNPESNVVIRFNESKNTTDTPEGGNGGRVDARFDAEIFNVADTDTNIQIGITTNSGDPIYQKTRAYTDWNGLDGITLDTTGTVEAALISDGKIHYDGSVISRGDRFAGNDLDENYVDVATYADGSAIMSLDDLNAYKDVLNAQRQAAIDAVYARYDAGEISWSEYFDQRAAINNDEKYYPGSKTVNSFAPGSTSRFDMSANGDIWMDEAFHGQAYSGPFPNKTDMSFTANRILFTNTDFSKSNVTVNGDLYFSGDFNNNLTAKVNGNIYFDLGLTNNDGFNYHMLTSNMNLDVSGNIDSFNAGYDYNNSRANATTIDIGNVGTSSGTLFMWGDNTLKAAGNSNNVGFASYGNLSLDVDGNFSGGISKGDFSSGDFLYPASYQPTQNAIANIKGDVSTSAFYDVDSLTLGGNLTDSVINMNDNSALRFTNNTIISGSTIQTTNADRYGSDTRTDIMADVNFDGNVTMQNNSGLIGFRNVVASKDFTLDDMSFVNIQSPDGGWGYNFANAGDPTAPVDRFINSNFNMTIGGNLTMNGQSFIGGRTSNYNDVTFHGAVTGYTGTAVKTYGSVNADHIAMDPNVVNKGRFSDSTATPGSSAPSSTSFLTVNGSTSMMSNGRICWNNCVATAGMTYGTAPVVVPPVTPPVVVVPPTPPAPVISVEPPRVFQVKVSESVAETTFKDNTLYVSNQQTTDNVKINEE